MANAISYPALAPLLSARTVHCDASAGNDTTGDGSSSRPWQTIARAWTDRLTFGELRAAYIVQLHGAGSYTMPVMGASVCSPTGWFIIQGDPSVDVINASGTFTGDMNTTTCVVNTSAGLGADTWKGKTVRITSGNCNGARCKINVHSDAQITFMLADFRSSNGAIANGDTFQIVTPGTVIDVPAVTAASGQPPTGCYEWVGGGGYPFGPLTTGTYPRHVFFHLSLSGGTSRTLQVRDSTVGFVDVDSDARIQINASRVALGAMHNGFIVGVGTDAGLNLLTGCGLSITQSLTVNANSTVAFYGVYAASSTGAGNSHGDVAFFNGVRMGGALFISAGKVSGYAAGVNRFDATVTTSQGAQLVMDAGLWVFAVTSGDALLASQYSSVLLSFGTVSGGTTALSGYGMHAVSGAKILVLNKAPTLTGGTSNVDMKAENMPAIKNADLSSNGQGSVDLNTLAAIARVAA